VLDNTWKPRLRAREPRELSRPRWSRCRRAPQSLAVRGAGKAAFGADEIVDTELGDEAAYDTVVVPAIEVQGFGLFEQPAPGDTIQG
jgi:hypothetical protein